ncbi:MAG TPA: CHAD domain-containing protein [Bacteroidota bacterium]|nr:CHAD domain-containing protein [Bacteroidota bacterium]
MARRWKTKPKKSLRENAQEIIPLLFDEFMETKVRVVGHPRLKDELHGMRLKGKMLRYIMEIAGGFYGPAFGECYEEIRRAVGLMGSIHDCDVQLPVIQQHVRELRAFNAAVKSDDRIPTAPMVVLHHQHKERRNTLFNELCGILLRWEAENFRGRILLSMTRATELSQP